jgi:4-hydroxy-3-methylbut-2-enyl diphosphate reductase
MTPEGKKYLSKMNDFGEVLDRQHSVYGSAFVKSMIENGGGFDSAKTGVSYRIPSHFGFCYGVEKSIDMAFETVRRFPNRRIFLTHDVIHNPKVNQDLKEKHVVVLHRTPDNQLILDTLTKDDIVVIAAFGSKNRDVEQLKKKDLLIVDTTCGAIVLVWKRVEKYAQNKYTSVIHGIWDHEETQATASQATKFGWHFIIIRNHEEARDIERFLKKEITSEAFMKKYAGKSSEGFDPAVHLQRIGIASQTTMLKSETLEIQEYLKGVYEASFASDKPAEHFMKYDTICSATQERQDALFDLLEQKLDLMIVIGGFNSSNTTHLSEIASLKFPTFHVRGPEDLLDAKTVRHLDPAKLEIRESADWLQPNIKTVGISTGASTPDVLIEKVIARVEEYLSA